METEEINHKESAIFSVGWLFGGNYTIEQTEILERIIKDFEGLCYLERQNIIDVLTYIYKNQINDEEVIEGLMQEYTKQQ